jgi:hypothetical protein
MSKPVLHYWYSALSANIGIELVTSDAEACRQRLYAARREAKDTDLDRVALTVSTFDPMRVWLVKRRSKDEKA